MYDSISGSQLKASKKRSRSSSLPPSEEAVKLVQNRVIAEAEAEAAKDSTIKPQQRAGELFLQAVPSQAEPGEAAEAIRKVDAELRLEAGRNGWAMRNSHYARGLGGTLKAPTGLQRTS